MPKKTFKDLASIGIVRDTDPFELPGQAWSRGQNVRFMDGAVHKSDGHSAVFGVPSVTPYWMLPVQTESAYYWLYAGLNKVYTVSGGVHSNITRQTASVDVNYSATADHNWNGGILSGIPVINNGVDDPQVWSPVSASTRLVSLKWDATDTWSTKNWSAKVIRPFLNYLIALDITKVGTRHKHLVAWSHPAAAGTLPISWDAADPTVQANERDLGQTPGNLVDCLPLGSNTNVIYKEDSTYLMRPFGGADVFSIAPAFQSIGALSRRCIVEFESKHAVLGFGDFIVHDGLNIQSPLDKRLKNWLFKNMDSNAYMRSFLVPNYDRNEIWICFPQLGASFPNAAIIWNYRDNTAAIRELQDTPHIGFGVVDPSTVLTWDNATGTRDAATAPWDVRSYNPTLKRLLMASANNLFILDDTERFNGNNMNAYVERTGLDFDDEFRMKYIDKIRINATATGAINIEVYHQEHRNAPLETLISGTFDPNNDEWFDCDVEGRFIGFRFGSASDISWSIRSFEVEYQYAGAY